MCVCVLFAVRKRHWARESVWFMRRGSRSGEREGEAHEEEAEDGRERERACTSGVYLGSCDLCRA